MDGQQKAIDVPAVRAAAAERKWMADLMTFSIVAQRVRKNLNGSRFRRAWPCPIQPRRGRTPGWPETRKGFNAGCVGLALDGGVGGHLKPKTFRLPDSGDAFAEDPFIFDDQLVYLSQAVQVDVQIHPLLGRLTGFFGSFGP